MLLKVENTASILYIDNYARFAGSIIMINIFEVLEFIACSLFSELK